MNLLLLNLLDCLCFTVALIAMVITFNITYREMLKIKDDLNFMESDIEDIRDRIIMLEYNCKSRGCAATPETKEE